MVKLTYLRRRLWLKPFLEYQLDFLKTGGIGDVVLCLGYQGKKIEEHFGDGRKFGLHIRYSYERERLLGTAGALKNAEHLLKDKFFVMYSVNSAQIHIASRLSIEFTEGNLPWGVNRLYVIEKITGLALPSLDSLFARKVLLISILVFYS